MIYDNNKYPTDAYSLTKILINIDSTNPGSYEKQIHDYICSWLDYHEITYITKEALPERNNIMAFAGKKYNKNKLIFICHMDTVVIGDDWTMPPLGAVEKDNKIYGRGACDMKSGLACAMSCLYKTDRLIKNNNITPKYPLAVIFSVDEEDFMRGVEKVIEEKWVGKNDLILDTEPTDGEIQVAHKGRIWLKVDFKGVTAHASTNWKGVDAIAACAEFISYLRKKINSLPKHEELGSSTITFGQVQGGYRPYVVADKASLHIDIRSVPPLDTKMITDILSETITYTESIINGIEINYEFTGNRPYIERYPDSILLKVLKNSCEQVSGKEQKVSIFTGYTDTAVIAGITKNKNCMSYGPGSLMLAHKPDEYVPIDDIYRCEKVLEHLSLSLL